MAIDMNRRPLTYACLALAGCLAVAGCEQANIYSEVDYNVTLDPSNTYYAGDPVRFNITGNPENLVFYSGEDGHEYANRNRYEIPEEDVIAMTLELQIQHRSGNAPQALDIYYTNDFAGLNGNDGAADRALVQQMYDDGMPGWTRIEYDDPGVQQDVFLPVTTDIQNCISNLCIAFHWHPSMSDEEHDKIDTYWVNGTLTVEIEGMDVMQYDLETLFGTAVMMDETIDAYHMNSGNGSIRLDTNQDITFAGGRYSEFGHYCEGWLFSTPMGFNSTTPDQGTVVKNMQNYLDSYEYTYSEPGTYQAVFVGRNANYIGSSEEVKTFRVTVLNRPAGSAE